MSETILNWLAFILYSLVVVLIGFYIWLRDRKRQKLESNDAYWEADQTLSGWAVGFSISASMMSISWAGVYGVQLFYWYGPGGAWLLIIPWLITMAGFFILTPKFRSLKIFSQPLLLAHRFGAESRKYLVLPLIFVFTVWAGAEIYAAGIIVAPMLKISLNATLFLIAMVVALYSYTGGFSAVVSTDKIQFILVALFMIILAGIGINALPQGSSLFDFPHPPKAVDGFFAPGLMLIALTLFAYLPGWLVETDVWIRMQAARSNKEARKGIFLAGLNSLIFVGLLPMLIGLSALRLYPPQAGAAPDELADGSLIFSVFLQNHAAPWLALLLSLGLIAAAMSTIDTCSNVVALTFSHDWLEPRLQNRWSAFKLNRLARFVSAGAVLAAFVYALFTESLWDIFYLSSGVLTTTIFLPVIASFSKRVHIRQVRWAAMAGFTSTIIFYFVERLDWLSGLEPAAVAQTGLGYILWGFIVALAAFSLARFADH